MEENKKNKIPKQSKQFELFPSSFETSSDLPLPNSLKVKSEYLINWRNRIYNYQVNS